MPRKPKSNPINNANIVPEDAYVTWGEDLGSKQSALTKASESLEEFTLVEKTTGNRRYTVDYSNIAGPNLSGRPGLTKSDYYNFRPEEAPPEKIKDIIKRAEHIYQRVGLVKNVIDLMGDFASQGIRLVHRDKRVERFYRRWFKKINGKDRSERFLNNLYKSGNVVIDRRTAKINTKIVDKLYKALGEADINNPIPDISVGKKEIPWKYTFLDPILVDVCAGALSSFLNEKRYELTVPAHLRKIINNPKSESEKLIVDSLPAQILDAANAKRAYPLDPTKTLVYHYKKDDWQAWAYPMIYAIMDDITIIEKLKLADMAALDGAISNIRIFKLGNLEHRIAPTRAATAKLASILGNNTGGGTMDLIWGPDIELIESKTSVHQFLGEGKYTPHLNSVYAGLGIPPTLTGTFGAAGTTNNFISLKTLTQRLQYGRDVLTAFWENEIALVQEAMGFRYPAKIEFDRMDLSNEDSEKALLVQLADRNLISDELLQTRFGVDPDLEKSRLNREHKQRKTNRMIQKSGPWHDPQFENSLKKIALQTGLVAPSQIGLTLDKKQPGDKTILELKVQNSPSSPLPPTQLGKDSPESLPGQPQQGRPKNSKDKETRKQKEFSPQTGASIMVWALRAQDSISNIVNPIMLDFYKKKNIRSLSASQTKELELLKTKILFNIEPLSKIDSSLVMDKFKNIDTYKSKKITEQYYNWAKNISNDINDNLSVEDQKQAKASFYYMVYSVLHTLGE